MEFTGNDLDIVHTALTLRLCELKRINRSMKSACDVHGMKFTLCKYQAWEMIYIWRIIRKMRNGG